MKQDLIRTYDMLPREGIVLCAVSGGADSMCLLHWLSALSEKYGYRVAAAHYHHGLRGAEADRDEAFVRAFCAEQEIPFYSERGDVAAEAGEHGWSLEEAGRNLRYAFLTRTAKEIGALRIATAHNRGDNAETVLMNLIRGTGVTGLAGIRPVRGMFIRPLLDTGRDEIEQYLTEHGIAHVEDSSNGDTAFTRNRVRREILPLLKEINPRVEESICLTARLMREEENYLSRVTEQVCSDVRKTPGCVALRRDALSALPPALQSRVIRRMVDLLQISKKDISARHIHAILELIQKSGPTARLSLPRGVIAQNVYEDFQLTAECGAAWERTPLPPVGEVFAGPFRIECRLEENDVLPREGRLLLNNDVIGGYVTVDRWKGSGRMTLPNGSSRSIKRLFQDAGLSVQQREKTPVVSVGNRVVAILGVATDAEFIPKAGARTYILDFYKR